MNLNSIVKQVFGKLKLVGSSDGTLIGNIGDKLNTSTTIYGGGTNPVNATVTPYQHLKVTGEFINLFTESFDSAGFDSVNRWYSPVVVSGGANSQSNGKCTISTNTTATSSISITSQPSFTTSVSYLSWGAVLSMETPYLSNTHRFWGFGTQPTSPSATNPLKNAIGFEVDLTGAFNAVIYSNGTRVFCQNLVGYNPNDVAGYAIQTKANLTYFYVNSLDTAAATAALITPDSYDLPVHFHIYNNGTLSGPAHMDISAVGVGDSAPNNIAISDGLYAWRKAYVSQTRALRINSEASSNSIAGISYGVILDTILLSGSEAGVLLVRNPSNSGRTLYFTNLFFASDPSNPTDWVKTRVYFNPTITTTGTLITSYNSKASINVASVASVYTIPTLSANGIKVGVMINVAASNGQPLPQDIEPYLVLPPGNDLLITGYAKSNNTISILQISWFEV